MSSRGSTTGRAAPSSLSLPVCDTLTLHPTNTHLSHAAKAECASLHLKSPSHNHAQNLSAPYLTCCINLFQP